MKRTVFVLAILILLLLAWSPATWACDRTCGISSTPWGETVAICLAIPENDAFLICVEINIGPIHTCFLDSVCRNGYPVS